MVSREKISSVYAGAIPVRPLFAFSSVILSGMPVSAYIKLCLQLPSAPRVRWELYSTRKNVKVQSAYYRMEYMY